MTLRFPNCEAAALAAAKLRDEGYFAEVCDVASAGLWGPGAVGGVRVIATDEPLGEVEELPLPSKTLQELCNVVRVAVVGLWLIVAVAIAVALLRVAVTAPRGFVLALLTIAGSIYVIAAMSMIWHRLLAASILRSSDKRVSVPTFLLMLAIVLVLALAAF